MTRVFNEIKESNVLTEGVRILALRYICIFLQHVKVGAIRGNELTLPLVCTILISVYFGNWILKSWSRKVDP